MDGELFFACADFALLRSPIHPSHRIRELRDETGDPKERLLALTDDPVVQEAIAVSSPSLARVLDGIAAGSDPTPADLRRAVRAMTAYRLRMATRSTPFGLMAGVAAAWFTDEPSHVSGRIGAVHRRSARPDRAWLTSLVADLERRPEILVQLRLTINNLCFRRGDRLVLPYLPDISSVGDVQEVNMRHTAAVAAVEDMARTPVRGADISRHLLDMFPHAQASAVEGLLVQLVTKDFLLTELRPPQTATDPLTHVIDTLSGLPVPELAELRAVRHELAEYPRQPLAQGRPALAAITARMSRLRPGPHPVHVDLALEADVRLPRAVGAEAARAAHLLWRIAPDNAGPIAIRQYHADFLARYGTDRLVRVKELMNLDIGLGAPADYQRPPSPRRLRPESAKDTARNEVLAALAQEALLTGQREAVLTESSIAGLATGRGVPPTSLELLTQVLATDLATLRAGDFQLVLAGGSQQAGAIFGRFAYLLGAEAQGALAALAGKNDTGTRAQLSFQVAFSRATNVVQGPQWLEHTLPVATFADPSDPHTLDLGELMVGADARGLYLVDGESGAEVLPTAFHMLNAEQAAPNVARFLREISQSGVRGWQMWDWGAVETLPYLPRVRHERTVLALARWRPDNAIRRQDTSFEQWTKDLREWRARWQVPDQVCAGYLGQRVELDLSVLSQQHLLRNELRRRPDSMITEVLDGCWLTGPDGVHRNEFVFPIVVSHPERSREPRQHVPARTTVREHLPGGEWLSASIFSSPDRQNDLLISHVPQLISTADHWFFVRYLDHDRHHLRLRLRGTAGEVLHDWAADLRRSGMIGDLKLETYEPELERYGDIEAAERLFHADSVAVTEQLRMLHSQDLRLDPMLLTVAGYVELARAILPSWTGWVLANYPKGEHHHEFQRLRREAVALVDPAGQWTGLRALPGGEALLATWKRRREVAAAYGRSAGNPAVLASLFHMHFNRFAGLDRDSEQASYAVLRGVIQSYVDRLRHNP
jgi:thiopeptide-type bacteriocin biosynthesis protein